VAPPFRQAEFEIMFDEGISRAGSVLDVGESVGVIQRQGSWLSAGETRLGQGREAARGFLRENPKLLQQLEERIRAQAKAAPASPVPAAPMPPASGRERDTVETPA